MNWASVRKITMYISVTLLSIQQVNQGLFMNAWLICATWYHIFFTKFIHKKTTVYILIVFIMSQQYIKTRYDCIFFWQSLLRLYVWQHITFPLTNSFTKTICIHVYPIYNTTTIYSNLLQLYKFLTKLS